MSVVKHTMLTLGEYLGPDSEWDNVAARHGNVFHTSKWLSLVSDTQPGTLHRLAIQQRGVTVGILPFFSKRFGPFKVAASPLIVDNTPYMGMAIGESLLAEGLAELGNYAIKRNVQFFRLFHRTPLPDIALLTDYKQITKHTHVLSLVNGDTAVWEGMEGRCRTAIRKAEKSGVRVYRATTRHELEKYLGVLWHLYGRQGMASPSTTAFYHELFTRYTDDGLCFYVAEHNGAIVAGAIILIAGNIAYYLNGASLPEANKLGTNNLVQWCAIRGAIASGVRDYDFVGSDIERLAKFKMSFGGVIQEYTLLEYSGSTMVRFARNAYPQLLSAGRTLRTYLSRMHLDGKMHNSK